MTECETHRELLGGYVLGALEPEEAEAVRTHLETCEECRIEHRELAGLPALLDLAAGVDPSGDGLPASFEERVLDRFARERRRQQRGERRWLGRLLPGLAHRRPRAAIGLACAVVLAASVGAYAILSGGEERRLGYDIAMRGASGAPRASAVATLWRMDGGTGVRLRVRGLPADPGVVYEMLCERSSDGARASAGTFRVERDGTATVRLSTAARVDQYDRLRVVRRAGGLSTSEADAEVLIAYKKKRA